jgi:hypothetical protein
MSAIDPGQERRTGDCTTTESFSDHGIDDARALTREAFADRPDAALRTEPIPTFDRRVAGFHRASREATTALSTRER